MKLESILSELKHYTGHFPFEAVRAAMNEPELMTPKLLSVLEEVANSPDMLSEPEFMLPTYAFYLLAQFREERAYPFLVKLFSRPGDFVLDATGDFVTEDLGRVLASVYGGDLGPIKGMIEDASINEYVRGAGLSAISVLVVEKRVEREEAVNYFSELFNGKLEKDQDFIWSSLVCSCCDLGFAELGEAIKEAYAEGLVDVMTIRLEEAINVLQRGRDIFRFEDNRRSKLIGNTVDEMSWWACFKDNTINKQKAAVGNGKVTSYKVGRNDPCPCGSGNKYKRCCLN